MIGRQNVEIADDQFPLLSAASQMRRDTDGSRQFDNLLSCIQAL
jgi:hypothetical protein